METRFKDIKLKKHLVLQDQVYEEFLLLLKSGQFQPGEKIPGSQKLALMLDTHDTTVHFALKRLEREGWVNRIPNKGTYVADRDRKLTVVGVYGYCGTTNLTESPFAHAVRVALGEELRKLGIEMDLWMDSRPVESLGEPWEPLIKAAERRRFQAFIGVDTNLPLVGWQQKLPVPVAFLGPPPSYSNGVDHDMRQFVEIGLRELARQGCRSVGLISPLLSNGEINNPESRSITYLEMLGHFMETAGELGLKVKNDWMRVCQDRPGGERGVERFGYEQFLELWRLPEKPEGLIAFTDFTARGMLMAIQEMQVRVPQALKLVLSKNETIDLFCPMPATYAVASERAVARALIEQIQKQFRGEPCERISLQFRLEAHNNPKPTT